MASDVTYLNIAVEGISYILHKTVNYYEGNNFMRKKNVFGSKNISKCNVTDHGCIPMFPRYSARWFSACGQYVSDCCTCWYKICLIGILCYTYAYCLYILYMCNVCVGTAWTLIHINIILYKYKHYVI